MEPGPGEPAAGPWQVEALDGFARSLAGPAPRIVAVDGRGGSGKTVLAERLRRLMTPAAVVQSDHVEARERGVRRDIAELGRTEEEGQRLWQEWEDEEVPFLIDDRPWERADVIVVTASSVPYDRETEVAVVRPSRPSR